jgi:hypothetical protein
MYGSSSGEPMILERLTLCLVALGRLEDSRVEADRYFPEYPLDRDSTIEERILARLKVSRDTTGRPSVFATSSEHGLANRQKETSRVTDGESDQPYWPDLAVTSASPRPDGCGHLEGGQEGRGENEP